MRGQVAVVGMAVRLPGAPDLESFWTNLVAGTESICRSSRAALLAAGWPAEVIDDPGFVPAAGLLDEAHRFDAELFGYAPAQAALLDPQQRQLLEVAWEALEHAGIDPDRAPGSVGAEIGYSGRE